MLLLPRYTLPRVLWPAIMDPESLARNIDLFCCLPGDLRRDTSPKITIENLKMLIEASEAAEVTGNKSVALIFLRGGGFVSLVRLLKGTGAPGAKTRAAKLSYQISARAGEALSLLATLSIEL